MKKLISIILTIFVSVVAVSCEGVFSERQNTTYDIVATLDTSNHTITGTASVDYVYNGESSLTSLVFCLHPNRYNDGGIIINSIIVDDTVIGFSLIDDYYMEVPLPYELFSGDRVGVEISFCTTIPNGDGILGYSDIDTRISGWYPVLAVEGSDGFITQEGKWGDYLFSEIADYTVRLTVPSGLVVASSGKRISQTVGPDTITYTYRGDNMRDFAFSCSYEYKVVSGVCGGALVSVYAYSETKAQEGLSYAQKSLAYYTEKYGPYPYHTYSVCESGLKEGGMEFSGLVYVNSTLTGLDYEEVIAHETAHQWWYGIVGSSPVSNAWLDEGLAEYSTYKYLNSVHGSEYGIQKIAEKQNAYSTLCDIELRLNSRCDIPMTQSTALYRSSYEYVMVTYVKGLLFFVNLDEITNGRLDIALRDYLKTYTYSISTPEDLRESLSNRLKLNLIGIFDAWESGKVIFCY